MRTARWVSTNGAGIASKTNGPSTSGRYEVEQFLTPHVPPQLLRRQLLRARIERRRTAGDVRGDEHTPHCPQWMVRGQRLGVGHVETRAEPPGARLRQQ